MIQFAGLQRCSTIDFPGNLCCVLFVRGCDLNCFYCHNRALLESSGPVLESENVWAFLEKRRGLLDGVVLSGGEPTLYDQYLPSFFSRLRALGYKTKLDTNGQRPEAVQALLEQNLVDYVAVDLKATAPDYHWVCESQDGFSKAHETLNMLMDDRAQFEARTTLYPGLNEDGLIDILSSIPPLPRYRLNFYRKPEQTRPQDALLLRRPALTIREIELMRERIFNVQPNAVW